MDPIDHLLQNTPAETLRRVYQLLQSQDPAWPTGYHLSIGMQVRNILRQKFKWDDQKLDAEWASLVEAAARQFAENPPAGDPPLRT